MTPFQVYKLYLAMKLHFTRPNYNIIKMKGRVRATEQSFAARRDLMGINRLARKYTISEITNFFVANFVGGDKNGGMFTVGSETIYKQWCGKMERLGYMYQQDLTTLFEAGDGVHLASVLDASRGHPPLLKLYLGGSISIETLVILAKCLPYLDQLDTYLGNDVIWPDVCMLVHKYSPFVRVDRYKYEVLTNKLVQQFFSAETGRGAASTA
jgi:hypothetical protein